MEDKLNPTSNVSTKKIFKQNQCYRAMTIVKISQKMKEEYGL